MDFLHDNLVARPSATLLRASLLATAEFWRHLPIRIAAASLNVQLLARQAMSPLEEPDQPSGQLALFGILELQERTLRVFQWENLGCFDRE